MLWIEDDIEKMNNDATAWKKKRWRKPAVTEKDDEYDDDDFFAEYGDDEDYDDLDVNFSPDEDDE